MKKIGLIVQRWAYENFSARLLSLIVDYCPKVKKRGKNRGQSVHFRGGKTIVQGSKTIIHKYKTIGKAFLSNYPELCVTNSTKRQCTKRSDQVSV